MNAPFRTATVTRVSSAAEQEIGAYFAGRDSSAEGSNVERARAEAFAVFEAQGLPHRRVEIYKYTDLRVAMRNALVPASVPDTATIARAVVAPSVLDVADACRIVIVDGFVASVDSVPDGVTVRRLSDALLQDDAALLTISPVTDVMAALNAAFVRDGVSIRVDDGIVIDRPLHVEFRNSGGSAVASRIHVTLGAGSSLTLIETLQDDDGGSVQSNIVVGAKIGDRALLNHIRVNAANARAQALSTFDIDLGAHAVVDTFSLVTSPALSRHAINVRFSGEHAKAGLRGASLLNGRQHADTTLTVDHAVPNGASRELYKHVIDGEATGVFQGKIIVQPHAQKTDGRMMSQALILGEAGTMNNKPELEIFADDVQCGHGATVGALDTDQVFYLMARGLDRVTAEALLIEAFVVEAIEEGIPDEEIVDSLRDQVRAWLGARVTGQVAVDGGAS